MQRRFRTHSMTLALIAVAFSLAFAGPAAAGGGHHGHDGRAALYAAVAGVAVYSAISHSRHSGHRYGHRYGHRGGHHGGRHHSRHDGHRGGHSGYRSEGGCHKVSKRGYYHGREARIGGTQCYDSYGNPYIVRGSRYVIEYY